MLPLSTQESFFESCGPRWTGTATGVLDVSQGRAWMYWRSGARALI